MKCFMDLVANFVRRPIAIVFLLVSLLVVPEGANAQSGHSYTFPGVTTDMDFSIANINPQSAFVTVSFYRSTGTVTTAAYQINSGLQVRLNAVAAGLTDFTGSMVVNSPVPVAVSATRFTAESGFEVIQPSPPGTWLVVPFTPLGLATVQVNLFNPGTEQAEVRIVPIRADGTQDSVTTSILEAKHSRTVSVSAANSTHLMLRTSSLFRSDRPIVANAEIQGYQPSTAGAVQRQDFAVMPATPITSAGAMALLPYFSHGEDAFAQIQVVNLGNFKQSVTLTARDKNGALIAGTKNPSVVSDLAAYGASRQSFSALFGIAVSELTEGTISVEAVGPVTAAVVLGNISKPSFTVLGPEIEGRSVFSYPIRRTGREFFTRPSLWNRAPHDANVTMSFLTDDGRTVSTVRYTIGPDQLLSDTLAVLFPEVQGNGYLFVQSDTPVHGLITEGRANNTVLAQGRLLDASENFVVPPLERFLAVGTVFDRDSGVPNVAIRLAGPVQDTTLTDAAGVFVFRDLPQGSYTLTPLAVGYSLTPNQRTFGISNDNSRQNDFSVELLAPRIDEISPTGVEVNSATTTITVDGAGFITSNVVVFETTELPTTFVNDTLLTAVIDKTLLAASGTVNVVVRSRGPSGNYVDSLPVTFTVGTAPPTLSSVIGQPNPLVAGKVTSPFVITVTGAGFTAATQVVVGGVGRATTFVSQTQLRATVLPSDVAAAGTVLITVRNPGSVASAGFPLAVLYPSPTVTAITPIAIGALIDVDAQALRLTISGSGFVQDALNASVTSIAVVEGVDVVTEFVSTTQLVATVPATLLASAGTKHVAIKNPAPTLGTSNEATLLVSNPLPVLTSLDAGQVSYTSQTGETLWAGVVLNGSGFSPDSTAWVNPPCDTLGFRRAQTTRRVNANQAVATIALRCAGNYELQMRSPQPGGGTSATLTLIVSANVSATTGVQLLAAAAAQSPTFLFPLFIDGTTTTGAYKSEVRLSRASNGQSLVQCNLNQRVTSSSFLGIHGYLYPADVFDSGDHAAAITTLTLDASLPWEILRTTASRGMLSGYAMLECTDRVNASLHLLTIDGAGQTTSSIEIAPQAEGTAFGMLVDTRTGSRISAVVVNDSAVELQYTILARDEYGQELDRALYAVSAKTQFSAAISDQLRLPAGFVGMIEVSSTTPFFILGIESRGTSSTTLTPFALDNANSF
jgi:hypothetical protein